jgi:hypothetical protein
MDGSSIECKVDVNGSGAGGVVDVVSSGVGVDAILFFIKTLVGC